MSHDFADSVSAEGPRPRCVTLGGLLVDGSDNPVKRGYLAECALTFVPGAHGVCLQAPPDIEGTCVDAIGRLLAWLETLHRPGQYRWHAAPIDPRYSTAVINGDSLQAAAAFGWGALAEDEWFLPYLHRIAITGTIPNPDQERWTARLGPVTPDLADKLEAFCAPENVQYHLLVIPADETLQRQEQFKQTLKSHGGWKGRLLVVKDLAELKEQFTRMLGRELLMSRIDLRQPKYLLLFAATDPVLAAVWTPAAFLFWGLFPQLYFLPATIACILFVSGSVWFFVRRNENHYREWERIHAHNPKQTFDRSLLTPSEWETENAGHAKPPHNSKAKPVAQASRRKRIADQAEIEMLRKLSALSQVLLPKLFAAWLIARIAPRSRTRMRWVPACALAISLLGLSVISEMPEWIERLPFGGGITAAKICFETNSGDEHCEDIIHPAGARLSIGKSGYLRISTPLKAHADRRVEVRCDRCKVCANGRMGASAALDIGVGGLTVDVPYSEIEAPGKDSDFQFQVLLRVRNGKDIKQEIDAPVRWDSSVDPSPAGPPR